MFIFGLFSGAFLKQADTWYEYTMDVVCYSYIEWKNV